MKTILGRILIFILTYAVAIGAFAGCDAQQAGESTQPPATPTPTGNAESTKAPSVEETEEPSYFPLTEEKLLSFWFTFPPIFTSYAEGPEDYFVFQQAQERLNVEIEFFSANFGAARDSMSVMIASDDYIDLIYGMINFYSGTMTSAIDDGIIIDLSESVNSYMPNYKAIVESNEIYQKAVYTDEGHQPAILQLNDPNTAITDAGGVIRKDWLDALNLDIPSTYDELYDVLTAFKVTYGSDGYGLPGTGVESFLYNGYDVQLVGGNVNGFYHVGDEILFGPTQEGFREYLEMASKWYSEGLIWTDFVSDVNSRSTGKVGSDIVASENFGALMMSTVDITTTNEMIGDCEFYPLATVTKNEGDTIHFLAIAGVSVFPCISISTACEDVELAARYLDWYFTEEGSLLCNYGVEHVTFEYDDNGEIYFTEIITNNPEGMPLNVARTLYLGENCGPYFYDNEKYNLMFNEMEASCSGIWRSNCDSDCVLPTTMSLTSDESTLFNSYFADIKTYVHENTAAFIMGLRNLAEFDAFVAQLEELHIDECCKVYKDAYARYIAR